MTAASCAAWNTQEFFETATVEDVTACLAAGADVAARNENDNTPLHWAAQFNENPAVIEALLAAGADLQAPNEDGNSPLYVAIFNENTAVPETLIEVLLAATDVTAWEDGRGRTFLHYVGAYGDPAAIEALLAAGADVAATVNEDPAVVQVLLAAGADVAAVAAWYDGGITPLHLVARNNADPAVLEVLLAAGADPNARASVGFTPLHGAAQFNENPAVVEALLAAGANVREDDDFGDNTPLHYAAKFNEQSGGDRGPDWQLAPMCGKTMTTTTRPCTTRRGSTSNPAVTKALLAAGANVREDDDDDNTPLHYAAWFNEQSGSDQGFVGSWRQCAGRR